MLGRIDKLTAAQAAQKKNTRAIFEVRPLTAAQAAQKLKIFDPGMRRELTAAQAAQKKLGALRLFL